MAAFSMVPVTSLNILPVGSSNGMTGTNFLQQGMATTACIIVQPPIQQTPCITPASGCKTVRQLRTIKPEVMRCKRRIDFNHLGLPRPHAASVERRNERERNRVKQVNLGFAVLREHVPSGRKNKKMSKVDTLRSAVEYIQYLQQLLEDHEAVDAALGEGPLPPVVPSTPSSQGSPASQASPGGYTSDSSFCSFEQGMEQHSDQSQEHSLSAEEEELMDFTSWF